MKLVEEVVGLALRLVGNFCGAFSNPTLLVFLTGI